MVYLWSLLLSGVMIAQCVVAFTIPIQRVSLSTAATAASSAAVAAESGFTKIKPFASFQESFVPKKYLLTRRFMNDESKNEEENKTNDSSEQINETKKSTAQKAKNGILLIPLVIKFLIVMAIKLLTDVVVLPILIIIRSPTWFPKYMKRLFGRNDETIDGGGGEASS
jgi:hypothetical protein